MLFILQHRHRDKLSQQTKSHHDAKLCITTFIRNDHTPIERVTELFSGAIWMGVRDDIMGQEGGNRQHLFDSQVRKHRVRIFTYKFQEKLPELNHH